jgi:cytochrome c
MADKQTGSAPFNVRFSAGGSFDYDKEDVLRFEWSFTQPGIVQSTEREPQFTFTKPGIFKVTVKAIDSHGETATGSLTVEVGNEPPMVTIQTPDNKSFYWDNSLFRYQVAVSDKEDGRLGKGIDPSKVTLRYHFKAAGEDMVAITQGHQTSKPTVGNAAKGRILIEESDCKACHAMAKTSVGPAYQAVAKRYRNTPTVAGKLAAKIIRGGGGAWGDREMSAHPQLSKAEAQDMVAYILSLGKAEGSPGRLPLKGQLVAREHVGKGKSGSYDLIASYTDRGGNGIKAITRQERITLKYPLLRAADADEFVEAAKANVGETQMVKYTTNGSYLVFKNIDLTGVKNLLISLQPKKKSGRIEIRLGSHEGRLIGVTEEITGQALLAMDAGQWVDSRVKLEPVQGVQDVYFVYKGSDQISIWNTFDINTIYFSR